MVAVESTVRRGDDSAVSAWQAVLPVADHSGGPELKRAKPQLPQVRYFLVLSCFAFLFLLDPAHLNYYTTLHRIRCFTGLLGSAYIDQVLYHPVQPC
jgi:hypothetical protein